MREGWTYKKLGEVCKTSSGGTPSKSHKEYYEGGSIPWLRSGEVAQGLIYDTELCITEMGLEKSSAKIFPIDTVVIAMYGATVGQVGILKCEMSTNQAVCGIFPNSKLYPLFLLYCLKSKKSLFLKDAVGGAQPNISQNLIKNTVIPIPPLDEQKRIVAELDLLSSIIDKKKAQLKELDQLAQAIFYDMFGDPITNEKGWKVKKMGEIAISDLGKTLNSSKDKGNLYPYLCAINVLWDKIDTSTLKETRFEESELERYSVKKGDLLICEGGDIGRAAIWDKEESIQYQNALHRVRFNGEVLPRFCLTYIKSLKEKGILDTRYGKGVTIKHLVKSALLSIPICIPPLPLQQEFAEKVEAIERQKTLIQQSIVGVQTMFDYTMDKYFG